MPDLVPYNPRGSIQELAKQEEVPSLVKNNIPQADWTAMKPAERIAALEFFQTEGEETTEGLKITFPRVKYPTSGAGVFEIPTASGQNEFLPIIEGAIVSKRNVRAWWPLDQPIANNPPECFSDDSVRPNPSSPKKQAEFCDNCPNAQFGSGKPGAGAVEGRGQACKQRINVFFLRDVVGEKPTDRKLEDIPTLLSIPPSQLKPFGEFAVQIRKQGLNFLSQCTSFGLKDTKSRDGTAYKALDLKTSRKLTYPEMQSARQIATAFKDQMESRGLVPDDEKPDAPADTKSDIDARDGEVLDAEGQRIPF